jgi:hypothetical protein
MQGGIGQSCEDACGWLPGTQSAREKDSWQPDTDVCILSYILISGLIFYYSSLKFIYTVVKNRSNIQICEEM